MTDSRGEPSSDVLKEHPRLKPLPGKRTRADDCSPQAGVRSKKQACGLVILNSSNMQGIPKENVFTRLARIQNEKSGNADLREKSGDIDLCDGKPGNTDPYAEKSGDTGPHAEKSGDTCEKSGDTGPFPDDRDGASSTGWSASPSGNLSELVDEVVMEINTQSEVDIRKNAGEETFAIVTVEATPLKDLLVPVPIDKAAMVTFFERPLAADKVSDEALTRQPVVPGDIFNPPFDVPRAGHVLVGGFSVPAQFEELYSAIWKKHGHIATTTKLKSRLALVNRVQEVLFSIQGMSVTTGHTVSEEMIEDWKCH